MSADVRSQPWLANSVTTASLTRIDGALLAVSLFGNACAGNRNDAGPLSISVIRRRGGADTGSFPLGAADQTPEYTAFARLFIAGREYRSDLSDNLGTGTGVLRIVSTSDGRLRGTFEFEAVPAAGPGARVRARVTRGQFDIPTSGTTPPSPARW